MFRTLMIVALLALGGCPEPRNVPVGPDPDAATSSMMTSRLDAALDTAPPTADALAVDAPPAPPPVDAPPPPVDAPPPPKCSDLMGKSCEPCGGTYACDGTCQSVAPAGYGKACDDCGGKLDCAGTCQTTADSHAGQPCDSCGAKFDCSGKCPPTNVVTTLRHVALANASSEDPTSGQVTRCPAGWEFYSCHSIDFRCANYKVDFKDLSECDCFAAPQVDSKFPLECDMEVVIHRLGCFPNY
jgi:hypothetical protein